MPVAVHLVLEKKKVTETERINDGRSYHSTQDGSRKYIMRCNRFSHRCLSGRLLSSLKFV